MYRWTSAALQRFLCVNNVGTCWYEKASGTRGKCAAVHPVLEFHHSCFELFEVLATHPLAPSSSSSSSVAVVVMHTNSLMNCSLALAVVSHLGLGPCFAVFLVTAFPFRLEMTHR